MQDVWDDVGGHEGTQEGSLGKLIFERGAAQRVGHTRHTKKDVSDIQREGNYIGYTGSEVGMEHNMSSMAGPQRLAEKAGGSPESWEVSVTLEMFISWQKRNWEPSKGF